MGGILPAIVYSFMPRTWRGSWQPQSTLEFQRAAVISGLLEIGVCGFFIVHRFVEFLALRAMQLEKASGGVLHFQNEGTQLYFLSILILEYVLQPLTLLLFVLLLEGGGRAVSAGLADQVFPSLPLQLAERLASQARGTAHRLKLPPLVVDEVSRENDWLRIESCRPKADWHSSASISFQDNLYEFAEERTGSKQRPWVYRLRPAPAHKVVRGMRYYDPQDVLKG